MPDRDQPDQRMQGNERFEQERNNTAGRDNAQEQYSASENNLLNGEEGNARNGRKSNRGFAAMSPERQKAIASEGGRAAHRQGVAHEWSKDEARQAGRKGGQTVSQNREHMSEIGRRGGQKSGSRRTGNDAAKGTEENNG